MLRARVEATDELIEAMDVKLADGSPPGPYACEFCRVTVLGSGLYLDAKNTPHFSLPRGGGHREDCAPPPPYPLPRRRRTGDEADGEKQTSSSVPNVLAPPDAGAHRSAEGREDDRPRPTRRGGRGNGVRPARERRTTVLTLGAIARAHRSRPDVADVPLCVPGVPESTYGQIVRAWRGTADEVGVRRVYYAPVLFRPKFRDAPSRGTTRVRVGSPAHQRSVLVQHGLWPYEERLGFRAEVDDVRNASETLYDHDRAHWREGWLYVLAAPDAPGTLVVSDWWAVCAVFV